MKKKRKPARRNPVAKALRTLKPKTEPHAKAYRRKSKHKGRPDLNDGDGLRLFLCPDFRFGGNDGTGAVEKIAP